MATQSIREFSFVSQAVRVIMIDDEPWFVAADVCDTLGYRMASDMTRFLDDDEKGTHNLRTLGGDQEVTIINESGLYSAIIKSRKPEAKKFKKWVTSEVLPALRRTGRYEMPRPVPTPALITPGQLKSLHCTAWSLAHPFYMKEPTRLWLLKYARHYAGVNRIDHIPAVRAPAVEDYLKSLRRPVDGYLRERIGHERAWLTQTLQRELDRRLGRPGPELELFSPAD